MDRRSLGIRCLLPLAALCGAAMLGCGGRPVDLDSAAAASQRDADVILALDAYDPWYKLNKEGRVQRLRLSDRFLTKEAMAEVNKLTALEDLVVARTNLDDELLAQLTDVPKLRFISLTNTTVTDDGLLHLAKLKSLREVQIFPNRKFGLAITDDGAEKLKAAVPTLVIS